MGLFDICGFSFDERTVKIILFHGSFLFESICILIIIFNLVLTSNPEKQNIIKSMSSFFLSPFSEYRDTVV